MLTNLNWQVGLQSFCQISFNLRIPENGNQNWALSSPSGGAKGQKNSDGDSKIFQCIFFTLNTYQETFISDILWNDLKSYSVTD